jgi:hypothetical protein
LSIVDQLQKFMDEIKNDMKECKEKIEQHDDLLLKLNEHKISPLL